MAVVLFKWLMTSLVAIFHPFYVGVTEVQHNEKEKTLEISVKLFIDDFESALNKQYKTTVDLANPKDSDKINEQVAAYLQHHLQLKVNGQMVKAEFLGYEKEREAAWCYIQVNNISTVKHLEVNNDLLYDVFDKQIHLIHVTVKGQRKSNKVSFPDTKAVFEFD
ncbi:DUF6702 family protein [Flavihumibacter stibioxidans]|uniref:Peptidase E n=1 Tax=Flavihumibacter stibioxidans TaxID=1834163 RepID=A0ABR7MBM1_9BACT|nr:DUF6702 family protein [Flavihumibacter stibioxidans]MBC6492367.1 hypothetical protein [Flavihumibacter stibioxidans]